MLDDHVAAFNKPVDRDGTPDPYKEFREYHQDPIWLYVHFGTSDAGIIEYQAWMKWLGYNPTDPNGGQWNMPQGAQGQVKSLHGALGPRDEDGVYHFYTYQRRNGSRKTKKAGNQKVTLCADTRTLEPECGIGKKIFKLDWQRWQRFLRQWNNIIPFVCRRRSFGRGGLVSVQS